MIGQTILPAALAFIMFAMGLTLTPSDFTLLAHRPRAVLVGLAAQMAVLPAIALGVALAWELPPDFAVGLMILAACPGGITSNLLTHLAGGRTALAVTLTAVTSLVGAVSVPLVINFAMELFLHQSGVEIPVTRMALGVFAVATLPLTVAMTIRRFAPAFAARIETPCRHLATALFALIVAGAFAGEWRTLVLNAGAIVPAAITLNVVVMTAAGLLARGFGLERPDTIAVMLETGLQNGALGIFVAANVLGSPSMMVPSVVYALVMNVTAAAMIAFLKRRQLSRSACPGEASPEASRDPRCGW